MSQITYTDKVTGAKVTAADMNEIKTVVNTNEAALLDLLGTPLTLSSGANELTFDEPYKVGQSINDTLSFTKAATGNVDGFRAKIILDQPVSVSFSSDFVLKGDQDIDLVTYTQHVWDIRLEYSDYLGKVLYWVVAPPTISSLDLTGPTVQSVTVASTDQDALVVVFDEAVNITDTTGLSLTGTAVTISSLTSGNGTNTLTFALSANLYFYDTVTFVYGATNNIEDLSGNGLAAGSDSVTVQFTDLLARKEEIGGTYSLSDQTLAWNGANRTIGIWVKGVNYTKNTDTWTFFGQDGSGGTASRIVSLNTITDQIRVYLYDNTNAVSKIIGFAEGTQFTDGNHHLLLLEYDYTNMPNGATAPTTEVDLSIDNSSLTPTLVNGPSSWVKSNVDSTRKFFFTGSNGTGGDIIDDFFIINRVLTAQERTDLYNSGSPVDVRTVISAADIECYVPFENSSFTDVMGNYTFTIQGTDNGSYVSDTPTNPA